MSTAKNNDKNKMNSPPPSFHSFLNWLKTAKSTKTLKQNLRLSACFMKNKSNCMSGLFCIANLLELGRKKTYF